MRTFALALSLAAFFAGSAFAAGGEGFKDKLGLTEEQSQKMEAARKSRREAMEPLKGQFKKHLATLKEQVAGNASDAQIQAALDEIEKHHAAQRAAGEQFHAQVKAILTPRQRAIMLLKMGKRGDKRKGKDGPREHGFHGGERDEPDQRD